MHSKHVYVVILLAVIFISCVVIITCLSHELSEQSGFIFTLFNPELQKASDDFYSEYLSANPGVANYSGKMISLKKSEKGYYVKFSIQPYIGPHFPVGDDEVEYFVDNIGSVTLLSFAHKKTYEFPERLGVTVKKPIPIS